MQCTVVPCVVACPPLEFSCCSQDRSGCAGVRGNAEMDTVIGHSSEISSPTVTSTQGMGILGDRVQGIAAVSK